MGTRWGTAAALCALGAGLFGCAEDEARCDPDAGQVCTWIGTGDAAFNGDGLPLEQSMLYWPVNVTFASTGEAYVLDWNNHRARRVTAEGTLQTVLGTDFLGDGPDDLSDLVPPGAAGTEIHLNHPTQLLERPDGSMILVSWHNHKLRRFDRETGLAYVMCGGAAGFGGDGGPMREALFDQPHFVEPGPDGALYVLDQRNQVIRKIGADGIVSTVAGTPRQLGFEGDGGEPLQAKFNFPAGTNPPPGGGLAFDAEGRLYIADTDNHRVRRVDFAANRIETVVGTGTAGYGGDGGPGEQAQIDNPRLLTRGPDGRIYIGDEQNNRIRAFDPSTGLVETAIGTGQRTFDGDGKGPLETSLDRPAGVVFGPDGLAYVLDTYNNRVRRVRL